jgi:dimethylhistidine N-methyltransferase
MRVVNLLDTQNVSKEEVISHFSEAVELGLSKQPKRLSSEYFYDDVGSVLFQKITQQSEYYLTKTELGILKKYATDISNYFINKEIDVVELGVGDGHKTKILIESFINQGFKVNFYPIDISKKAINLLQDTIQENDSLTITAVIAKYFEGINYIHEHSVNQQLVLFLGSNIGNTDKCKGENFLHELQQSLSKDDLLLTGLDLIKDIEILNNAYNDKNGYTRQFNLNLLTRMNNELGANFDVYQFEHLGRFNPKINAMESFLVSKIDQVVYFERFKKEIEFREFEPLHLEYSFKYSPKEIESLADKAGFNFIKSYTDDKSYFIDSLWRNKAVMVNRVISL